MEEADRWRHAMMMETVMKMMEMSSSPQINRLAGLWPHHCVHVSLSPDDVVVVVDDHGPAEHMQVLHDVLLHVGQRGDVCVVA